MTVVPQQACFVSSYGTLMLPLLQVLMAADAGMATHTSCTRMHAARNVPMSAAGFTACRISIPVSLWTGQ
jgi:hypothetical protein